MEDDNESVIKCKYCSEHIPRFKNGVYNVQEVLEHNILFHKELLMALVNQLEQEKNQ